MPKILLVEDDNNLREIYGARLSAEGYDIVSANDGEEALAIAVKEKPDLVISDVMMPRISGFDMLDILRNAPETKDTKVIMMTALSQAEDKARADKLGADLYLVKSQVTLEDVAKAVRDILNPDAQAIDETAPATAQEGVPPAEAIEPPASVTPAPTSAPEAPEPEDPSAQPAVKQPTEPSPSPQPSGSAPQPAANDDSSSDDTAAKNDSSADQANPPGQSAGTSQPDSTSASLPIEPPVQPTPQPGAPPDQPDPVPEPEKPETPPAPEEPVSSSLAPAVNVAPKPQAESSPPVAELSDSSGPAVTPIKVVLPDEQSSNNKPSGEPIKNDAIVSEQTPKTAIQPSSNIGPNVAEALANEEKTVNEQAKPIEKKFTPPPPPAPSTNLKIEVKDAENHPTAPELSKATFKTEEAKIQAASSSPTSPTTKPADKPDAPKTNMADEKPRLETEDDSDAPKKKVLQPSEDFLKSGSNIEALLDKEMAKEAVARPQPESIIKPPESQNIKQPDQVLDEIQKNNREIDKIAL